MMCHELVHPHSAHLYSYNRSMRPLVNPMQNMAAHSNASTPSSLYNPNEENEAPHEYPTRDLEGIYGDLPQYYARNPPVTTSTQARALQPLPTHQYPGYVNYVAARTSARNPHTSYYAEPQMSDQVRMDSIAANLSPNPQQTVYSQHGHGLTINGSPSSNEHEEPAQAPSPLSDLDISGFGQLSLADRPRDFGCALRRRLRPRHIIQDIHISRIQTLCQVSDPSDVILVYDKGEHWDTVPRDYLCIQSEWFIEQIERNPCEEMNMRCIRLRDDFPYAIKAMIDFVNSGFYSFDPGMSYRFPRATMLDLHVHVYVTSLKYQVPRMFEFAFEQYMEIASDIVRLEFAISRFWHPSTQNSATTTSADQLLNSMVLLWRNTIQGDYLRMHVLELVKHALPKFLKHKVFVSMLADLADFELELRRSLAEDGVDMTIEPTEHHGTGSIKFASPGMWRPSGASVHGFWPNPLGLC